MRAPLAVESGPVTVTTISIHYTGNAFACPAWREATQHCEQLRVLLHSTTPRTTSAANAVPTGQGCRRQRR